MRAIASDTMGWAPRQRRRSSRSAMYWCARPPRGERRGATTAYRATVGAIARATLAAPNRPRAGCRSPWVAGRRRVSVIDGRKSIAGLTPRRRTASNIPLHSTACAPYFIAAVSDSRPNRVEPHGFLHEDGPHAGDTPSNILVGDHGTGRVRLLHGRRQPRCSARDHSMFDADGSETCIVERTIPTITWTMRATSEYARIVLRLVSCATSTSAFARQYMPTLDRLSTSMPPELFNCASSAQ